MQKAEQCHVTGRLGVSTSRESGQSCGVRSAACGVIPSSVNRDRAQRSLNTSQCIEPNYIDDFRQADQVSSIFASAGQERT